MFNIIYSAHWALESISWELALKPAWYIYKSIPFTPVENISWELALKPGYNIQ